MTNPLMSSSAAAGGTEEVTELLIRSLDINDGNLAMCHDSSVTSNESFSFKGDALRSHTYIIAEATKAANRSELLDRLERCVQLASSICSFSPLDNLPKDFIVSLITLLMTQLQSQAPVLSSGQCQSFLTNLALLTAHPNVSMEDKLYFINNLHRRHGSRFLQFILQNSSSPEQGALYRLLLMTMARQYSGQEEQVFRLLETFQVQLEDPESLMLQKERLLKQHQARWRQENSAFQRRCHRHFLSIQQSHEDKLKAITALAIEATGKTMAAQDALRKQHLFQVKEAMANDILARRQLADIVANLTHEKGPWPLQKAEQTWKLDEVEGPQRMRIRLRASYNFLQPRFYQNQVVNTTQKRPLDKLLRPAEERKSTALAETLIWQIGQDLDLTSVKVFAAQLVMPEGEVSIELLLTPKWLHFVQKDGDLKAPVNLSLQLDCISQVLPRWYQLNDCALEFFSDAAGITRLVSFGDTKARDSLLDMLNPQWKGSSERALALSTKRWQEGLISNFDYLMTLNVCAGRTFCDLMQYPIFPWVLSDYTSQVLDLNAPQSYRDLRKPISVQQKEKEEHYVANYRALTQELQKSHEMVCGPGIGPYHYGSHYSNTGIVLHFMVRVSPFTAIFLKYQDGSFDIPDRTFHHLEATWKLASGHSTTDVKELIPELFYLPEMLVNEQKLQLGQRQGGEKVDHVQLPPWAKSDPRLFVKIHRQALESEYVSENLHHWIDLIFGHKQKGQSAVEAINVFHPATYYGFDLSTIKDPIQRQARYVAISQFFSSCCH